MEILKCGIEVTTKLTAIKCIVTGVSIRFGKCSYELSYFNNGDYKQIWMDESEFEIDKKETIKIGYK